jgi:hypothetical protein
MTKIVLDTLKCIRKLDVVGDDEPYLYIAGQQVWSGKMHKGDSDPVGVSRNFNNSVAVELKEKNNNTYKSLGSWMVNSNPTQPNNPPLTATSAGYHYELFYDVVA